MTRQGLFSGQASPQNAFFCFHKQDSVYSGRGWCSWAILMLCLTMLSDSCDSFGFYLSGPQGADTLFKNRHQTVLEMKSNDSDLDKTRRQALNSALATYVGLSVHPSSASAGTYIPAKRPTAYFIDATIPPTMIPLSNAQKQRKMLRNLGYGSGTDKEAVRNDSINLNNMLNKAVFGTADAISKLVDSDIFSSGQSGGGFSTYVCLGVPARTTNADINLASSLLDMILSAKMSAPRALGLWFVPLSAQTNLDAYTESGDLDALQKGLVDSGVASELVDLYKPLFLQAKSLSVDLLAMSPEYEDLQKARSEGLQNVNAERRSKYVVDTEGFIGQSSNPRFKLYTDRSLLKDFEPLSADDTVGNFFAQRILVHETGASALARYGATRPKALVCAIAPIADLRFFGGINGRIPRNCEFLNPSSNQVTENQVTTILLNPTAVETTSKSTRLRLEIGTGPDTLPYQTKVSDYVWFSTPPKISLLHRLMNG